MSGVADLRSWTGVGDADLSRLQAGMAGVLCLDVFA